MKNEYCLRTYLTISSQKYNNNSNNKFDGGKEIKPCIECTYLGTKIDQSGENTTEIKQRISQTRKVINALTLRLLMSYIYGAPILDVSRSHTTTQHSR